MNKSGMAIWAAVVPMLMLGLTAGCESQHSGAEADFTNQSATPVDVYRNDEPQFTLMPCADQSCDMAAGDIFSVVDQATQRVRGSYRIVAPDDVLDFTLVAVIRNNHVNWLTRPAVDVNTADPSDVNIYDTPDVSTTDTSDTNTEIIDNENTDDTPNVNTDDTRRRGGRRPPRGPPR